MLDKEAKCEPGVEAICRRVNGIDGVETYASCEGHPGRGAGRGYVAMYIQGLQGLSTVMSVLPTTELALEGVEIRVCVKVQKTMEDRLVYVYEFAVNPTYLLPLLRDEINYVVKGFQTDIRFGVLVKTKRIVDRELGHPQEEEWQQ